MIIQLKKRCSVKKTYNEIPVGFEIQKNLHITYDKPEQLSQIISALSKNEIYDLVRVDYYSTNLETKKEEIAEKAKAEIEKKIAYYEEILGISLDTLRRTAAESYKVYYPVERYQSYQAYKQSFISYNNSKLKASRNKKTTLYYQPIMDKEFDFVVNPVVSEPVIQIMYEIKIKVNMEYLKEKGHYFINTDGTIKELPIK